MKDEGQVARYVVNWFGHLMTPLERRAQRHLSAVMKATHGKSDREAQREAQKTLNSRWMSNDPDVLQLTGEGYEAFVERTAERIQNNCRNEVLFNRCPRCGRLARTPTAKQCRFCGHDWHD